MCEKLSGKERAVVIDWLSSNPIWLFVLSYWIIHHIALAELHTASSQGGINIVSGSSESGSLLLSVLMCSSVPNFLAGL